MAILVGQRLVNLTNSTTVSTATTGYVIHTFSTPGTTSFAPTGSGLAEVLVVGGGGGRGTFGPAKSGGGGGSVLYAKNILLISNTTYPITIGQGTVGGGVGGPGGNTILNYEGGNILSPGGAQGSTSNPLGSGGGGIAGIGSGVVGYGFPGGLSPSPRIGSSGGGASSGGGTNTPGGAGLSYSISGTLRSYGGGGGGGGPGSTTGSIHPNSSPTDFGLGGGSPTGDSGNPGCIIIRYPG